MKKAFLTLAVSAMLTMPVFAADPVTLTEKLDRLDEVVYGSTQQGSLIQRTDGIDNLIYGTGNTSANGLDDRVNNLYVDVVKSGNDQAPSISTRVNALEYYLSDEVKREAFSTRLSDLEKRVYGQTKTGALDSRVSALEKTVYGDQHFEMKSVTLPANTVFKISLNDDVSSKVNQVGDVVNFTVQEDVKVGDVLVLPRGTQGSGVVTKVTKPKSFGRSGALDISFDQVFSVDDEAIPTVLGPESKEKLKMEAAAVGASAIGALALGPVGLVGGFFVKGKDVVMPQGTTLYIQTREEVVTKGIELTDGAPTVTVRKRIQRGSESKEAVKVDVSEKTEAKVSEGKKEAEAKASEVKSEAAEKAETSSKEISESAKKELEDVKNKSESKSTSVEDDQGTSVVIVRNE